MDSNTCIWREQKINMAPESLYKTYLFSWRSSNETPYISLLRYTKTKKKLYNS